jgi:LuxR family maltose regulon positive regulatory protein
MSMKKDQIQPRHWLADTKFQPPLLREDVITRQRLTARMLEDLRSHRFLLLSAPAGYGKTTLLGDFSRGPRDVSQTSGSGSKIQDRIAWVSLDAEDNDPVRFLKALITSLQRLDPDSGSTDQSLLVDPYLPIPDGARRAVDAELCRVVSVLINYVMNALPDPFALILDDLHHVNEPAIFAALDYLLDHIPPQMHLVVGTRVDPPLGLARLRARGQLAELRMADLRFTIEETTAFLNDGLSLNLPSEEVEILHARTEGWAVGLRLFANSLCHLPPGTERRTYIEHQERTDRFVFEFLADEVLNQRSTEMKDFLLQTAILAELTHDLCKAVTERDNADTVLDEAYRQNLFLDTVIPLQSPITDPSEIPKEPPRSTAYRYHELFAEFLRHRLEQEMPDRVSGLHHRAAQAETDITRRVGHYLAASSWHEAAKLIEAVGAKMLEYGYLETLRRWINTLPSSIRESRPRLLHYLSNCALWKGDWTDVRSLLERARKGFQADGDAVGEGEVLVKLATHAIFQSNWKRGSAILDQALDYPISLESRIQSLLGRASLKFAFGDWAQAETDFDEAIKLIEGSDGIDPLDLVTYYLMDLTFVFLPGGLEHLKRICARAKTQFGGVISPSRLAIEEMTMILHLFQGQLTESISSGEKALDLREQLGGHPFSDADVVLFLIIAHAIRGNYAAAEPLFANLSLVRNSGNPPPSSAAFFLFLAGRVRWLQGRLREARELYAQMCALEDPERETPDAEVYRTWMWSLLAMAEGRYAEAERALRQPEILDQRDRCSTIGGSTRLMLARLYWEQDRRQEALAELSLALAFYRQLGIPWPILAEGQSIVPSLRKAVEQGVQKRYAAFLLELLQVGDEPCSLLVPTTGETLTPREVEVLRLLVVGHSNRAIAESLVISEWTVKSHLTRVYSKLDVASRAQAIVRARELGVT